MTEERKAVKTLAEELVKAIYTAWEVSPPRYVAGGNNAGSISATRITGLPAVLPGILSQVFGSISGPTMPTDAVATQIITAIQNIAAGNYNTLQVDTATIERVYGTFAEFIYLIAEDAIIGNLDVETIRAKLADIGLINIGSATISTAQIERLSTGTAFVREEIGGKLYIDDLAVSEANIVSLAAGEILLNDSNGNLVRLYVDATTHSVTTEPVAYNGSDIINQNSLNGNRIIQNSITTAQLNASEIFAYQGTIMDLIVDNLNVTRLFTNQGFISQLQATLISSDLSQNQTIITLGDEINLMASNVGRTYVQNSAPLPKNVGDTWFNPLLEEHYVSTGVIVPQMEFAHDGDGYLCNQDTEDYQFQISSSGQLMLLPVSEEAQRVIADNNIDFSIVDDHVYTDKVWKKVENVAFANLKVSVDGIVSEVYDSQTGLSRIQQNADRIQLTVNDIGNVTNGTTPIPYVKTNTSSIEIKNDKVVINSSGDVDIKANKFSIMFNTDGNLYDKSRVEISDSNGIKVSNQYGGYFQATYNKLGLYDIAGNAKLEMRSDGNAYFSGNLEAATGVLREVQIVDSNNVTVASLGDTLTIGKTDEMHANIVSNAYKLVDKDDMPYFDIGDLRDSYGYLTTIDIFTDKESTNGVLFCYTKCDIYSIVNVTVDGVALSSDKYIRYDSNIVRINQTITRSNKIEIKYITADQMTYISIGSRAVYDPDNLLNYNEEDYSIGQLSFGMGKNVISSGIGSFSFGTETCSTRDYSIAIGEYSRSEGKLAIAIGDGTLASGLCSLAGGALTETSGNHSVSYGHGSWVTGSCSMAIGADCLASGDYSFAAGHSQARNNYSFVHGEHVASCGEFSHVFGRSNVISSNKLEVVGNGAHYDWTQQWSPEYHEEEPELEDVESNARTLDWNGNEWIAGTLTQASDQRCKTEFGVIPDMSSIHAHSFIWNDKKLVHDDKQHIGYYAQEIEQVAPYLVSEDEMGYKSLDYIALLCAKVEYLERRVKELEVQE